MTPFFTLLLFLLLYRIFDSIVGVFKTFQCIFSYRVNNKSAVKKTALKKIKEDHIMPNTNELAVPGAKSAIDQMKYEIASEFGVNLGPDATARANGSVGGEITKRLVQQAQSQFAGYQK
jgi:small acid-soluble spore protein B (major beta-type SASP)